MPNHVHKAAYYQSERVTLYCGDCLEILPTLPDGFVSAVVTDPPWKASAGARTNGRVGQKTGVAPNVNLLKSVAYGDIGFFSADAIREFNRVAADILVLCGYMELSEVIGNVDTLRGVFAWHNTRPTPIPGVVAARNLAYIVWGGRTSVAGKNGKRWASCVFAHDSLPAGCMATERILNPDGSTAHPAQEPLALFRAMVAPLGESVLDPYTGSGTTAVAAIQEGKRFIGIEREEKYCAIAKRRIQEAEQAFALFEAPKPEIQSEMFPPTA